MEAATLELVLFWFAGASFSFESLSLRSRKGTEDGPDAECFTLHIIRACWVVSTLLDSNCLTKVQISVALRLRVHGNAAMRQTFVKRHTFLSDIASVRRQHANPTRP